MTFDEKRIDVENADKCNFTDLVDFGWKMDDVNGQVFQLQSYI